jgi:hypothetical protein
LTSAVHITPELMTTLSVDRSYGLPSASPCSSARAIGLPNASPTMAICVTPLRCTARHISSASKCRDSSVTIVPPMLSACSELMNPVPCMSGDAGRCTGVEPASATARATAPAPAGPTSGSCWPARP